MFTVKNLNDARLKLSFILLVYFALSFYLLFYHDFKYIIDPDATSYISIAQKYLRGNFKEAINGHWSPLISWLAIPFMITKIRPLLALKIVSILAGGFSLIGIDLLLSEIKIKETIKFFYGLSLSPLIAWYALSQGKTDILSLCVLIFYVCIMTKEGLTTNRFRGITAGLLGAIAYLSKSYNFYFFLLHFTCFIFIYWHGSSNKNQRNTILINGLSGLLVFLLVSSLWISLLTVKYHKLTVSTAGEYNFSYIRPGSPGQMVDTDGLLAPPNKTALSAWEDPTYIKKVEWSPFRSINDFKYFVKNAAKNGAIYFLYISRNHILFFTIIYFVILSATLRFGPIAKHFYLFLTTFLHPLGYLMLLVEERYFWFDYILLYILSAYVLDTILRKSQFAKAQKAILSTIIFLYIAILPIIYIQNAGSLIGELKQIYFLGKKLNKYTYFKNARIASKTDNWSEDLYLSYYIDSKYYGKVKYNISGDELRSKLINNKIQYFFVHGKLKNDPGILMPGKTFGNMTIYKVNIPQSGSSG